MKQILIWNITNEITPQVVATIESCSSVSNSIRTSNFVGFVFLGMFIIDESTGFKWMLVSSFGTMTFVSVFVWTSVIFLVVCCQKHMFIAIDMESFAYSAVLTNRYQAFRLPFLLKIGKHLNINIVFHKKQ